MPDSDMRAITLERDEWRIVHQAFNEVLNGFGYDTPGVADHVNATEVQLREMYMDRLDPAAHANGDSTTLYMTPDDIQILERVLGALRFGLDEWDFQTRMGYEPSEVETLQRRLKSIR